MFKHLTGSEVSTRRVPLSRLPGGNEKWIPGFWLAVLVLVSPSHGGSVNNRDLVMFKVLHVMFKALKVTFHVMFEVFHVMFK